MHKLSLRASTIRSERNHYKVLDFVGGYGMLGTTPPAHADAK